MASEGAEPAAPQSEVVHVSTTDNPARIGTYTDPDLTTRNSVETLAESDQPPKKAPGNSQGDIRPVYANDQLSNIENDAAATANASVEPPPKSPNSWARGTVNGARVSRDPYANQGMVGQPFFNHQGGN
jgi:hypothetical protein